MSDVVVVGCGFAGFWSAVAARRVLGTDASISVVAPGPGLVIRPRLYQAAPQTLVVDVASHFEALGVAFIPATARGVDLARRELTTDVGPVPYERLIAATGSVLRPPPQPGAEAALSIDQIDDAIEFDNRLGTTLRVNRHPTIAVIGAGFTGIELALELRDRIATHSSVADGQSARIVLIDKASVAGDELGAGPRPAIEAALRRDRIELRLGARIARIEAEPACASAWPLRRRECGPFVARFGWPALQATALCYLPRSGPVRGGIQRWMGSNGQRNRRRGQAKKDSHQYRDYLSAQPWRC